MNWLKAYSIMEDEKAEEVEPIYRAEELNVLVHTSCVNLISVELGVE